MAYTWKNKMAHFFTLVIFLALGLTVLIIPYVYDDNLTVVRHVSSGVGIALVALTALAFIPVLGKKTETEDML